MELLFSYELTHSCTAAEFSSVRIEPENNTDVKVEWEWKMQRTGSIPPGTVVNWQWLFKGSDDQFLVSDQREITWTDTRFEWREMRSGNVRYHWYDGDDAFAQKLAERAKDGIDRLELGRQLELPVEAFVYSDSAAIQGAILYTQAWTGGLAFVNQNILLIAISPNATESELNGLIHELAHLLVSDITFGCIGDMPTWLEEGLAEYAEGPVTDAERTRISDATAAGDLITIRSLSSSFPADHSSALLAYTQSKSIVTYLIESHGWTRMNELLATFQKGSTNDRALTEVYGFDMDSLNTAWRTWTLEQ